MNISTLKGERKMQIKRFRKVTIVSVTTMLFILTLLMMLPFAAAYVPGACVYASSVGVPVTIDGVWSAGEWDDTLQYIMTNSTGGNVGYVRAKFNSTHLLIIIDSPWDTTNSTVYYHENVWLAFDTLNDGGANPQWDDYLVHATTSWTSMGWMGSGNNWTQTWLGWAGTVACVQAGENFGWGTPLGASPNSATPHRISEMAVPLALVGSPGSTVGFYVQVDDDSTDPDGTGWLPSTAYSEWPPNAGGSPGWPAGWFGSAPCPAPNAWGNLQMMLIGDVNNDNKVDIFDLRIAAKAFGSTPSDPDWNPIVDLDNNGLIDVFDLRKIAKHYGETA